MSQVEPRARAPRPRQVPGTPHKVDALPREARPFQGQRAGIVTRTAANVVDFGVVVGVLLAGYAVWSAGRFLVNPAGFRFPRPPSLAVLIAGGVILLVYLTVSWAMTGRTYGGHLLGLRVVNFRDEPIRWAGSFVRAGFCIVFPVGLFWAVVSPTGRSVQDTVLRTSVIYDWTTRRRPVTQAAPRSV